MTYDAILVARRGLGPDEIRLIQPAFASAVRWALLAEKLAPDVADLRRLVALDTPDGLTGAARVAFMDSRRKARAALKVEEAMLYPPDEVSDG
jgi:hypothetical protein